MEDPPPGRVFLLLRGLVTASPVQGEVANPRYEDLTEGLSTLPLTAVYLQ